MPQFPFWDSPGMVGGGTLTTADVCCVWDTGNMGAVSEPCSEDWGQGGGLVLLQKMWGCKEGAGAP